MSRNNWIHYRTTHSDCPFCGKPVHVGVSMLTLDFYWLHDSFPDQYRCTVKSHDKGLRIEPEEGKLLTEGHEPSKGNNSRVIRCVETGAKFPSIAQAARVVGVASSSISVALKKGSASGGHHWEYVEAPLPEKD